MAGRISSLLEAVPVVASSMELPCPVLVVDFREKLLCPVCFHLDMELWSVS
jgi:hypothetical protein